MNDILKPFYFLPITFLFACSAPSPEKQSAIFVSNLMQEQHIVVPKPEISNHDNQKNIQKINRNNNTSVQSLPITTSNTTFSGSIISTGNPISSEPLPPLTR